MISDVPTTLTLPHIFRDGRAGKYWITDGADLDGPFDDYSDAAVHLVSSRSTPFPQQLLILESNP